MTDDAPKPESKKVVKGHSIFTTPIVGNDFLTFPSAATNTALFTYGSSTSLKGYTPSSIVLDEISYSHWNTIVQPAPLPKASLSWDDPASDPIGDLKKYKEMYKADPLIKELFSHEATEEAKMATSYKMDLSEAKAAVLGCMKHDCHAPATCYRNVFFSECRHRHEIPATPFCDEHGAVGRVIATQTMCGTCGVYSQAEIWLCEDKPPEIPKT